MNILVSLIPGLGSETNYKSQQWCVQLASKLTQIPGVRCRVDTYTSGTLPEDLMSDISQDAATLVLVGHSDGAACAAWIQDHAFKHKLGLNVALIILLDDVTDLIRHGFLPEIHASIVGRCVRIFQTADLFIHSDSVKWDDNRPMEFFTMKDFGEPGDLHTDVPNSQNVQTYIYGQVLILSGGIPDGV